MTKDEALTIEALKYAASKGYGRIVRENSAPFTIKEALAQPAQEPVAWMYQCTADNSGPVLLRHRTNWAESNSGLWTETPLYTAPPQRPWVGLTEDEMSMIGYAVNGDEFEAMRLAEAKLKEKNR